MEGAGLKQKDAQAAPGQKVRFTEAKAMLDLPWWSFNLAPSKELTVYTRYLLEL